LILSGISLSFEDKKYREHFETFSSFTLLLPFVYSICKAIPCILLEMAARNKHAVPSRVLVFSFYSEYIFPSSSTLLVKIETPVRFSETGSKVNIIWKFYGTLFPLNKGEMAENCSGVRESEISSLILLKMSELETDFYGTTSINIPIPSSYIFL